MGYREGRTLYLDSVYHMLAITASQGSCWMDQPFINRMFTYHLCNVFRHSICVTHERNKDVPIMSSIGN